MITRVRQRLQSEQGGGTFMMFLLSLPLLIGLLGLSVDTARGIFIRQSIENNVQGATVSAGTQRVANLGENKIDLARARATAIDVYTANRANYVKQVKCATSTDITSTKESLQGNSCKWILADFGVKTDPVTGNSEVFMVVKEQSINFFLQTFKLKTFKITVDGSARIANSVEMS